MKVFPIYYILLLMMLSFAGAIFTEIKLLGVSFSALITLSAAIIPLLFINKFSKKSLYIGIPFIAFCFFDAIAFIWQPYSLSVLQDFIVWTGMLMLFLISSLPFENLYSRVNKLFYYSLIPFMVYMLFFVVIEKDNPATMILSLLFFSFSLSKIIINKDIKKNVLILILLFLVPIYTGSRIIYIADIAVFIYIFYQFYNKENITISKMKKLSILSFILIFILFVAIILQSRIESVMLQGDNANIAGVSINTSGRMIMWGKVVESIKKKPLLGHGVDGSKEMLAHPKWQHPHNDYLRILHHSGALGLSMWLLFFFSIISFLSKNIKATTNREYKSFYVFNLTYLYMILIVMITDNPIVYSYVMYPLMILSGISIGLFIQNKHVIDS